MKPMELLAVLHTAERLKDTTRHCYTSQGRHESVAEHSDIPSFEKTAADTAREDGLLARWVAGLPQPYCRDMAALYAEMDALETPEARLYKALDKLEAVISHNESPLDTWLPLEYDLNLTYANDNVAFSPYLTALRQAVRQETEEKVAKGE